MPTWERYGWQIAFEVFGPLDWRRDDLLDARDVGSRCATSDYSVNDYVLFPEPPRVRSVEELQAQILQEIGQWELDQRG